MTRWSGRAAQVLLRRVLATYGSQCHLCQHPIDVRLLGQRHPDGPSVDHLIPRSKGGTNDMGNLRPAHQRCNSRRGNRPLTPALLARFRSRPARASGLRAGFF
ncbi:HNH endonuclease [Populibacterium corticicola]|uniref:HNH endonuclease n=1 Tax=Populibacterium corticicola TaxID=1812826 RepID=A0ABW5XDP6_9MICO